LWWSNGNGSCDCNRELKFDSKDIKCKSDRYFVLDLGNGLDADIDFTDINFTFFNGGYDNFDTVMKKLILIRQRNNNLK